MRNHRFPLTTRGEVLILLKKHGPCTVAYLGRQLKLTTNAVRQHLAALERDNLVSRKPVKIGPRKPSLAYSLTPLAERLFPKKYESLVTNLMRELIERDGRAGISTTLGRLGRSIAEEFAGRVSNLRNVSERVAEVTRIMEEAGSIVEWDCTNRGMVLRDFNCPYSEMAGTHPEVCHVQRNFLGSLLAPALVNLACVHRENNRCEFEVTVEPETPASD